MRVSEFTPSYLPNSFPLISSRYFSNCWEQWKRNWHEENVLWRKRVEQDVRYFSESWFLLTACYTPFTSAARLASALLTRLPPIHACVLYYQWRHDQVKLKVTCWWDFPSQLVRHLGDRYNPKHQGSQLAHQPHSLKADLCRGYPCTNDNDSENLALLCHLFSKQTSKQTNTK